MKKITVVGAGGTGHTVAADLSMRGFDVRLCDSEVYRGILDRTAADGGIRITGMMENGFAKIGLITTDTAAALKAAEIYADALVLAKNVDGVYSADPNKDPNAVRYSYLTYQQVIEQNLQATDLTAITLCKEQKIPVVVCALKDEGAILRAINGQDVGTVID